MKDFIKLLKQEIKWHEETEEISGINKKSFIKGLNQALFIACKIKEVG